MKAFSLQSANPTELEKPGNGVALCLIANVRASVFKTFVTLSILVALALCSGRLS